MGILERIQSQGAPTEPHPLAEMLLEDYFAGESVGFSEDALADFSRQLVELCTERKSELPWAMMSVVKFCMYLHQELKQGDDCNALLCALEHALPFARLNNEPILEHLRELQQKKKRDDYRALIANDLPKIAPQFGLGRPALTVHDIRPRRKFK